MNILGFIHSYPDIDTAGWMQVGMLGKRWGIDRSLSLGYWQNVLEDYGTLVSPFFLFIAINFWLL